MKKIIVATDYSAIANNAVHFSAHLAHAFQADLLLFNVFHVSSHAQNGLVPPSAIDRISQNNEDRLKDLVDATARQYDIHVQGVVKTADIVDELEKYAADEHADLVVMGMESNLTEYKLLGNTTTAAIRGLKVPVLVVPGDARFKGIAKVLYACEYTYVGKDNHLDLLKEFTRRFGAELQVLHVETKAKAPVLATIDDQVSAIDPIMEDVGHAYAVINNSNIGEGIIQGAETWQADLLVMVPHKAGFLESLLKGSTTRQVTLRTAVPLLVLPNVE